MTIDDLLAHLKKVRKDGAGWKATCPAHPDSNPSLSIGVGKDGRILVKCWAGCSAEAVVAAMGLRMRDLAPDAPPDKPGLTVAALAQAKRLDALWLKATFGIVDAQPSRARPAAVRIPYFD